MGWFGILTIARLPVCFVALGTTYVIKGEHNVRTNAKHRKSTSVFLTGECNKEVLRTSKTCVYCGCHTLHCIMGLSPPSGISRGCPSGPEIREPEEW